MDSSHHDVVAGDTFPVKLHKLLHAAEQNGKTGLISWLPDGQKFKVHDKARFAAELMPHYFASCTYKSFQRSKNLWGFQTISKGVHKGECSHPLFVRGNINLCRKMTRVRTKTDDNGDTEQTPAVANDAVSNVSGSSAAGLHLGGNLMQQSGLNPGILLGAQHWQQQQQQLASINQLFNAGTLGNQPSSNLANNRLLIALSTLGSGNGNSTPQSNLLAARQLNVQTPPPVPAQSMQNQVSALQQLLQLASQPPQQQTPTSSLSQIMALLALQQQQQQQPTNSGVGNLSMLSATTSMLPPLASVANPVPSLSPPIQAIKTTGNGKRNAKGTSKSNRKSDGLSSQQEKTDGEREAALLRGSKVVACRARGMALDHNIHTAFFEIPKNPEHGMDLICSFPTCRNGGIKFLYCKYCDEVIAKRTFRTHHAHEDLVSFQSENNKNRDTATTNVPDDSNQRPSSENGEEAPNKRRKRNQDKSNDEAADDSNQGDSGQYVREIASESSFSSSSPGSSEGEAQEENGMSDYGTNKEIVVAMRAQWDALLDERQNLDSKDDISDWLDRVVDTSERFQKASRRSNRKSS